MVCFHPLNGYYSATKNKNGKREIVFNLKQGLIDMPVTVPCGKCVGCRLERSKQWAVRCMHEAQMHEYNCFITLTFDDDYLDADGSLRKRDFTLFMKRFRKKFGADIRFFHCGEYGSLNKRPHHHAIVFNFDFGDKVLWKRGANPLWRSADLEKLWPYGFCTIGAVTFESCAYVARYIMKKINGEMADEHYANEFGVIREPEYITMSRRPGIASTWFDKYGQSVYNEDFVVMRGGIKLKPPRYYDNLYDLTNPKDMNIIRRERRERAASQSLNSTPERLKVREEIANARLGQLKRNL